MEKIQKIKGFSDLFPPESTKFSLIEQKAREVFTRFGYQEMRLPVLERTELFSRSIGGETDIVQKEMYTFADRKGRSLTLRPEATAGVVRAFIENNLAASGNSLKLFTFGPMFRYERPQKGRLRQFHQIDVEILSTASPHADAEVILMLMDFMAAIRLENLTLQLNALGCRACRPDFHSALKAYLASLGNDNFCEDCKRRSETNPLRVLDCKVPQCATLTKDAPSIGDHLCPECATHFASVKADLTDAGQAFVLNPRLVRGLDYYQRTAFEVVSGDIGAQSSVAGGGRYDGLIQDLGGPDLPGVGFACGMERLAMLMPEDGLTQQLDFFLAVLDDGAMTKAVTLAQTLRRSGLSGDIGFEGKSMKSQLRQANRLNAKTCLILGADELARQEVMVKNMASGEQSNIAWADLTQALIGR